MSSFSGCIIFSVFMLSIAKPPWKKLGRQLESATRKALYTFSMVDPSNPSIAIALSGGKDSLSLLFLLHAISGKGFPNLNLYAVHVSGNFSCGAGIDENYLKEICQHLNIPLIITTTHQSLEGLECYSCSRKRRSLIFEAAKQVGAKTIAFGHHRDDNAQTLLLNLFHKGECAGLLPKLFLFDYDVTIIRPLIFISENELKNFAKEYGFARITCQCPVGQNSMRKQVDHVLSDLETLFPNVRSNVAQASLEYGSDKATRKGK